MCEMSLTKNCEAGFILSMTTTEQTTKTAAQTEQAEYAARVAQQIAAHRASMDDEEREIEAFYIEVYSA